MAAIRDGSGAFMHGHTYQAHPVAAAAALAVQQVIREETLLDNVKAMGALLEKRLIERLGNHRHVGDIRGRGLFWAVEFVTDRATKDVFDPALQLHERVKAEAYERGLACYPMGGTIDAARQPCVACTALHGDRGAGGRHRQPLRRCGGGRSRICQRPAVNREADRRS